MTNTRITVLLKAPADRVYRALTDPRAVEQWMVPDGMTSQVHQYDAREGGAFRVSLTYNHSDGAGKSTPNTDTYSGRFIKLVVGREVVQTMTFETADLTMQGEMTVTYSLSDVDDGTELTAVHQDVPPGISPEDNETGWRMSLAKLARLVEGTRK